MNRSYLLFLLAIGLRTAIVALFLVVGLRLSGKRRLAQLNIYDLALVMAAGNAVQNAMTQGSGRLLAGIVSAGVLIGMSALAGADFCSFSQGGGSPRRFSDPHSQQRANADG